MQTNEKANIVSQAIFLQTAVVKAENAASAINSFLHSNYQFFFDEADAKKIKEVQKILETIDSRKVYDKFLKSAE